MASPDLREIYGYAEASAPMHSAGAGFRLRLLSRLDRFAANADRHPWVLAGLLVAIYLPAAFALSRLKPLWHDELFTYYIAQAPSLRAMWSDLSTHDLNPPLVYLLTRLSFRIFGVGTLATRLPEIGFYLIAMLGVFRFIFLRLGGLFAAFAVALLLLGTSSDFAIEARPYALLLGSLAVAMVGWQEAAAQDGHRRRGLVLLGAGVLAMLLSHIFSVAAIAALLAAELWRSRERGRFDGAILAALIVPFVVVILYVPMLHNHGAALYPRAFQPTGATIFEFYVSAVEREFIVLLLTALAVFLVAGRAGLQSGALRDRYRWCFPAAEWVAVIGLLALPLLLMTYLLATHGAFFPRYGVAATLGVVLLTSALLCRWTAVEGNRSPRAALLGLVIALLISHQTFAGLAFLLHGRALHPLTNSEPVLPPCDACRRTATAEGGTLPLVDAGGLTFVEMNHHESAQTLQRVFYLTDAAASTQYAHANIFEQMPALVERFHLRGRALSYGEFTQRYRHFFVLGRYDWPEDWLLRKLTADGADIRLSGRTTDEYRDHELYEITLKAR